jgi:hypothetical protein
MLKAIKRKLVDWWFQRKVDKNPEQAMQFIKDLAYPPEVNWDLSYSDEIILGRYVLKWVNTGDIDYEGMVISEDHNPKLYRLTLALQGKSEQKLSWAAYDWMLDQYPDLKKLTEEVGREDAWG